MLSDPPVALMALTGAGLFLAWSLAGVFIAPFPSQVDELQHLSFIRAIAQNPTLSIPYGRWPTLTPDLKTWTDTPNYLAHPSLYYLFMSLLPFNRWALRFVNLALAFSGVALALVGLVERLTTRRRRMIFALLIFLFPRTITTACMVNNDNLVMFETGLLMFVLGGDKARPLAVAILLALVGWTKLNAFVGLAALAGFMRIQASWPRLRRLRADGSELKPLGLLVLGCALGSAPVAINLIRLGRPVYTPVEFLYIAPAHRLTLDFSGYAAVFVHRLALKFPPVEGRGDCGLILLAGVLLAGLGAAWRRSTSARESHLARAAAGALAVFFCIHLYYGWRSFQVLGTLSDAQMRYYAMLWPVFVFAVSVGADQALSRSGLKPIPPSLPKREPLPAA
jgi:hypothetical protein